MNIGNRIKELRNILNLTQEELAVKSNLSQSAIKYYESNRRNPKIETLNEIAKALNVPITDLLDNMINVTTVVKEIDLSQISTKDLMDEIQRRLDK